MIFYSYLKSKKYQDRRKIIVNNLKKVIAQLDEEIPQKNIDSVLLGTWNIRDLDKQKNQFGNYGRRLDESLFYIAEIISRFDIVAVQEVNNLDSLKRILRILGPNWNYIATDITPWALGGNGERLTYVYDERKVRFRNIAGEVVLPESKLISKVRFEVEDVDDDGAPKKYTTGKQFRRTPFLASFQSGWFKFNLCTVHLYFGANYGQALDVRINEIRSIANYFHEVSKDKALKDEALILLGDFNIMNPNHKTMKALIDNDFVIPSSLTELPRGAAVLSGKYYDQIAFRKEKNGQEEELIRFIDNPISGKNSGIFNIFENLFDSDEPDSYYVENMKRTVKYKEEVIEQGKYDDNGFFRQWKTYQLSDHNVMWVKLNTNSANEYLEDLEDFENFN